MTTRRVRGASLGLVIILVNILLVAALVIATSSRTMQEIFNPDDAAPTDTASPPPDAAIDTTSRTVAPVPPPTGSLHEVTTQEPPGLDEMFEDGEDLTVVVFGDQTGTDPADWVRAWAELLSTERTVEYSTPTADDPTLFLDPTVLGDGEASVSIFNASLVGGTPDYAAERLGAYLPQGTDVVLLNFGRSNTEENLEDGLDQLWTALEDSTDAAVYAVVQPPRQDGAEQLTDLTRGWAEGADAPMIDVAQIFEDEGLTEETVSTRDPLSVNLAGAARWAQIVQLEVFGTELTPVESTTPSEILPPTLPTATQPPADEPTEPVDPVDPVDPPPYDPPPYTPPPYTPPPTTPEPTTPAPPPTTTQPPPTTTQPPPTTDPSPTPSIPVPTEPDPPGPSPTEPSATFGQPTLTSPPSATIGTLGALDLLAPLLRR